MMCVYFSFRNELAFYYRCRGKWIGPVWMKISSRENFIKQLKKKMLDENFVWTCPGKVAHAKTIPAPVLAFV